MANRQLVDYVKEQLSHKADINALRTLMLQQGWNIQDVEDAIGEAYSSIKTKTRREHHTHFPAVAVAAIVVVVLAAVLFVTVLRQTEPNGGPDLPPDIDDKPVIVQNLSGWQKCQVETDSVLKDACYQKLNRDAEFDCGGVTDEQERGTCYRAKEAVLLQSYSQGA